MIKDGYHVIGHSMLKYWEKQAASPEIGPGQAIRAARDIKLLVGLLDAQVAIEAQLTEAIIEYIALKVASRASHRSRCCRSQGGKICVWKSRVNVAGPC